jgi:hypothetical protein
MNNPLDYWQEFPSDFLDADSSGLAQSLLWARQDQHFAHYGDISLIGICLDYHGLNLDRNKFVSLHKKSLGQRMPDRVVVGLLKGKGRLPAHTDNRAGATLNFYIEANEGDYTQFHEKKDNSVEKQSVPGQSNGQGYWKQADLTLATEFRAKKGSAILLNSQKIHSVVKEQAEPRIFVSYIWEFATYQEIQDQLSKTLGLIDK